MLALFVSNYEQKNTKKNWIHPAGYLCAHGLLTAMHMRPCVCVRRTAISHWIKHSKGFSWDWFVFALTCKFCWKKQTLWFKYIKRYLFFLVNMGWFRSDYALIIPLPLSPSPYAPLCQYCTEPSWTQCLKISKWLSEGLPSCCMLMLSALHWRINTRTRSEITPNLLPNALCSSLSSFTLCPFQKVPQWNKQCSAHLLLEKNSNENVFMISI